jgi:hypothetical protein
MEHKLKFSARTLIYPIHKSSSFNTRCRLGAEETVAVHKLLDSSFRDLTAMHFNTNTTASIKKIIINKG